MLTALAAGKLFSVLKIGTWATAGLWLLGTGLVMAALAAVAGLIDVLGGGQIRQLNDAWLHAGGNVCTFVRPACAA